MLTRCPACETTFRITPEQLKARQGRVRCGQCQHVFNALDTLIEELAPSTPAAAAEPAPAPQPVPPVAATTGTNGGGITGNLNVDFELDAGEAAPATEAHPTPAATTTSEAPPDDEHLADSSDAVMEEAGDGEDGHLAADPAVEPEPLLHEDMEQARRRAWPWVLASLLVFLLLALQAALLYRVELAVLYPESRPLLVEACNVIGCELALPSRPELMSIESSDLHPDANQPGRLQLVATLKNRAPFAQTYPHLELTLTDTADQALARKVLTPSDYLAKDVKAQAGFSANKDMAITLNLDVGSLPAAGYRLYLFYP